MHQLGYGLAVEKCLACGKILKSGKNFFSPERGGFGCTECFQNLENILPVKDSSIKLLRIFAKNRLENLTKLTVMPPEIQDLEKIAKRYLAWVEGD
jgi:recombinational DNA repair protein (RecF pathway)